MSSYVATTRSNYFKVKDLSKFKQFCREFELNILDSTDELVGFYSNSSDGSITSIRTIKCIDQEDQILDTDYDDFLKHLSTHLESNHVAIIMSVGQEKLQYVTGDAMAVNSKGETKFISLVDIIQLANTLGTHVTEVSY